MKVVVKIVYAAFVALLGFVVYFLNYNTGVSNNTRQVIIDAAKEAYETNSTVNLIKSMAMYEIPYNETPAFATKKVDQNLTDSFMSKNPGKEAAVTAYESVNQLLVYTEASSNGEAKAYADNLYFFLVSNANSFAYNRINDTNKTAIVFKNSDGATFTYYLDYLNEDSNSQLAAENVTIYKDSYGKEAPIEYPTNAYDAALWTSRAYAIAYSNATYVGDAAFMMIPVTETLVNGVRDLLGNKDGNYTNDPELTAFNITNNEGKTLYAEDQAFNFSFNTKFFNDLKEYRDNYRIYADASNSITFNYTTGAFDSVKETKYSSDDKQKAVNFLNTFMSNFSADYTAYSVGYSKNVVYTAGLVWQSLGIVAIFVVAAGLIYILIFKFSWLKKVIFRKKETRYVPTPRGAGSGDDGRKDTEGYRQGNQTRKNNNYASKRAQYAPKATAPVRKTEEPEELEVLETEVNAQVEAPVEEKKETSTVDAVEATQTVEAKEEPKTEEVSEDKTEDVKEA